MVETKIIAGITGIFGVIGLLLLYLVRRTRPRKRKNSECTEHVGTRRLAHNAEQQTPEKILFKYLYDKYWSKRHKDIIISIPDSVKLGDFKQVARVRNCRPLILIIYSKRSVWELGLSDYAEQGLREKFCFVLRGPKSFSNEERAEKFYHVMQDLIEFRQVWLGFCFVLF